VIALTLPAESDADHPFVTRLGGGEKPTAACSRLEQFGDDRSIGYLEEPAGSGLTPVRRG
jgi:hypothetical protein